MKKSRLLERPGKKRSPMGAIVFKLFAIVLWHFMHNVRNLRREDIRWSCENFQRAIVDEITVGDIRLL